MSYSTLTVVSLALLAITALLGIIVVKLLRGEKRRSDARVAMLAEMASDAVAYAPGEISEGADEASIDEALAAYEDARAFHPESDALHFAHDEAAPALGDLFAPRTERSAWPKRIAVAGALAVLLVAVVAAARTGVFGAAGTTAADPARPASAAPQPQALLELLSLKQSQEANTLTITGLVQNPRGGAELAKVTATAFLFGADGTFLASGRAPLDFTVLKPGDESGFVINVPVNTPVARYRVGFRDEGDRVIGHVDRRSNGTIARGPS